MIGNRTYNQNGLDVIGRQAHNKGSDIADVNDVRGYDVVIVARERSTGMVHMMTTLPDPNQSVFLLDQGMELTDGQRLPPN